MRSIRVSLVLYFLLLQGLALGAVMWVVYRTGEESILEKQRTTTNLLQSQYDTSCEQERKKT